MINNFNRMIIVVLTHCWLALQVGIIKWRLATEHWPTISNETSIMHGHSCFQNVWQAVAFLSHRGLPPWRGGGAYAPMTQTII